MSTTIDTDIERVQNPAAPEPEAATPAPEPPARKTHRLRTTLLVLRTIIVVLILLAAAVAGGTYIVRQRVAGQAFVDAGTAVLTAEPITVGSADAGVVTQVLTSERQSVAAGATLAKVTLTGNGGSPQVQDLRAPAAGIVTQINVAAGQVARGGEPVVTLYDPAKLAFQVDVPLETLRKLRLGMTAYVTGPGLAGKVATTLQQVEPKVDATGPAGSSDRLTVVLRPDRAALATVRTLVPGLQFDVVVDTKTAAGRTPAVNSA
jgi:multidrug resistance efflux pump